MAPIFLRYLFFRLSFSRNSAFFFFSILLKQSSLQKYPICFKNLSLGNRLPQNRHIKTDLSPKESIFIESVKTIVGLVVSFFLTRVISVLIQEFLANPGFNFFTLIALIKISFVRKRTLFSTKLRYKEVLFLEIKRNLRSKKRTKFSVPKETSY